MQGHVDRCSLIQCMKCERTGGSRALTESYLFFNLAVRMAAIASQGGREGSGGVREREIE